MDFVPVVMEIIVSWLKLYDFTARSSPEWGIMMISPLCFFFLTKQIKRMGVRLLQKHTFPRKKKIHRIKIALKMIYSLFKDQNSEWPLLPVGC